MSISINFIKEKHPSLSIEVFARKHVNENPPYKFAISYTNKFTSGDEPTDIGFGFLAEEKWQYMDLPNAKLIYELTDEAERLDEVQNFSNGIAKVKRNGLYGFINEQFIPITEVKYDDAALFIEDRARVCVRGKWGFVNISGEQIVDLKYDETTNFIAGLALVKFNGKYGFIDKNGDEIIAPKYDKASSFNNFGLALIKLGKRFGYIDRTEKQIVKIIYEKLGSFYNGLAKIKKDRKFGFINQFGEEIIPPQYDQVGDFQYRDVAMVRLDSKEGLIDSKGNWKIRLN